MLLFRQRVLVSLMIFLAHLASGDRGWSVILLDREVVLTLVYYSVATVLHEIFIVDCNDSVPLLCVNSAIDRVSRFCVESVLLGRN